MSKNRRNGFWYWMTLSQPAYYWIAKLFGNEAEEQAEAAMEDMGPVAIIIIVIGFIIWGIGKLFGAW